jgi:hypothetical protein
VDPRAGLDDVEKRKFLILPGLEIGHIWYFGVCDRAMFFVCLRNKIYVHKTVLMYLIGDTFFDVKYFTVLCIVS